MSKIEAKNKLLQNIRDFGVLEVPASHILTEVLNDESLGDWCKRNSVLYELNEDPPEEFRCALTIVFTQTLDIDVDDDVL